MDPILSLRPFVPAKDFTLSKRFYQALGFTLTHQDDQVAGLKLGSFGFLLQNFYVRELAENYMLQLLVRDADRWWQGVDGAKLAADFGVKPPVAPALQSWGLRVGYIFDPSGVLWHVAESLF